VKENKSVPLICETVTMAETLLAPAGAAHLRVVPEFHETVAQVDKPRREEGVASTLAKFKPVMVTEPDPHVGVLPLI
jgi:hypothetical protein